jgi:shikimate kinase
LFRDLQKSSELRQHHLLLAAASVGEASAEGELELEFDFDLLSTKISELVGELDADLQGCSLYLVGMMGSGKSTVAKMLSNTLKYKCFDVDTMVELAHEKKPVSAIFREYGQEYFRDCEAQVQTVSPTCLVPQVLVVVVIAPCLMDFTQVLKQLSPYKSCVVATGGGAVLRPM